MNTSDQNKEENNQEGSGPLPPNDEVQAGEYVLGVLDRDERRQARARIARDPAFAGRVIGWEERLAPWFLRVEAITPTPQLWAAICAELGLIAPGNLKLWNRVGFWRTTTALAVAASFAVVIISRPGLFTSAPSTTVPVASTYIPSAQPVTVLFQDNGQVGWIASIDTDNGRLILHPVPSPADAEGRVEELWLIPAGQAPVSLGRVSNKQALAIDVPKSLRTALVAGSTLAVSLETAAGIPHAAPTGPIIAKGSIDAI